MLGNKLEIKITDFTQDGRGVGHDGGLAIFVPYALPGDIVEVEVVVEKKRYLEAEIVSLIEASPARREIAELDSIENDFIPLVNLEPEAEKEWKINLVKEQLKRIAEIEVEPNFTNSPEFNYRNKANLRVNADGKLSLSKRKTNEVEAIDSSPIFQDEINDLIRAWNESASGNAILQLLKNNIQMVIIRANRVGETMLILMTSRISSSNKDELMSSLSDFGVKVLGITEVRNSRQAYISKEISYYTEDKHLKENILGIDIKLSPESFLQVNQFTLEDLYGKTGQYFDNLQDEVILDLYCGIGISSIDLARQAKKIIGVESVKRAIDDAKENAEHNSVSNVEFIAARAEDVIEKLVDENKINKIIVDPPRQGLDRVVVDSIIKSGVKEVLYMSCNPASLARDLKLFADAGFKVVESEVINQFPNTSHVETVVLMSRVDK